MGREGLVPKDNEQGTVTKISLVRTKKCTQIYQQVVSSMVMMRSVVLARVFYGQNSLFIILIGLKQASAPFLTSSEKSGISYFHTAQIPNININNELMWKS
jgi:hypothetical protein